MYRRRWPARGTRWAMARCGVPNETPDGRTRSVPAEPGSKPAPGPKHEPEPGAKHQPAPGPEVARAGAGAARARGGAGAGGKPQRRAPQSMGGGVEAGLGGQAGRTDQSTGRNRQPGGRRLRGYSGPGPDPRDPQAIGAVLAKLVKARGWQRPAAEATVFA